MAFTGRVLFYLLTYLLHCASGNSDLPLFLVFVSAYQYCSVRYVRKNCVLVPVSLVRNSSTSVKLFECHLCINISVENLVSHSFQTQVLLILKLEDETVEYVNFFRQKWPVSRRIVRYIYNNVHVFMHKIFFVLKLFKRYSKCCVMKISLATVQNSIRFHLYRQRKKYSYSSSDTFFL